MTIDGDKMNVLYARLVQIKAQYITLVEALRKAKAMQEEAAKVLNECRDSYENTFDQLRDAAGLEAGDDGRAWLKQEHRL